MPDPSVIFRLLTEAAPLAMKWSGSLCHTDANGRSCAGYHGLRPYWRLLDLVTSPSHHVYYTERLRQFASSDTVRRVLISGCADQDQLMHVVHVCREMGVEPAVTVVDRCHTPLELCRWYAQREGVSLTTVCTDIKAYRPDERFDVICTHSFLSWFPPRDRRLVLESWYDALRPGGVAVTVNRIRRPSGGGDPLSPLPYDERETDAFCALVAERAAAIQDSIDATPAELADLARQYRESSSTFGIRSQPAFEQDFLDAGFEVEISGLEPPQRREWRRERELPGGIRYVGVAARRPVRTTG
ncbi:MAG: class I SAM-dependent methyltransferase [Gammaproteobacteria bacterium]|nr:class I SAM-dependent methyltransferase [Gammaproteobacteria bacterium]